jgi:isochorismate synthase
VIEPSGVARAERLGPAFDLLSAYVPDGAFFEREGVGAGGSSPALRISFTAAGMDGEDARRMLRGVFAGIRPDPPAPSPVLFASIPFDPTGRATGLVPRRTVRRMGDGETWSIEIPGGPGGPAGPSGRPIARSRPHGAFSGLQLHPVPSRDDYEASVSAALARIAAGLLRKVVLARALDVAAGRGLGPAQLAWRLRAVDPGCFTFAFPRGEGRVLVGASPELLVARRGTRVLANPLAGSAPRSGDPDEDRANGEGLLASAKDREEHAVVVEAVEEALSPFCDELERDGEPRLLGTANVWHLSTPFRGTLRRPAADALSLAIALHPTPAVCGTPREEARRAIRELERFDRDGYAGPIGWVDAEGDGEFAIALRCAELSGDRARLFAGAGIVAGSVPARELDETERKFRAFLDSLRWG